MLVICNQCFTTQDTRPGTYCPGCLATGHWSPLQDEAGLRRGIEIYRQANIPRQMAENAIASREKAIRLLNEAEAEGGTP